MSASLSEHQLRSAFHAVVGGFVMLAAGFYVLQNSGALPGGDISIVKLAWLWCTILFWFLLPGLLLLDRRMPPPARRACIVLLAGMLVRGVVELFMMYVTHNWHPWLGIGHNLLMIVLMTLWLAPLRVADQPYAGYLVVATAIFIPETGFAWYMLNYATDPDAVVYFVGDDAGHTGVLIVTAVCVAALVAYLVLFYGRWLHGKS